MCPCRKIIHLSREDAQRRCKQMRGNNRPYRCTYIYTYWHVTSHPDRPRNRLRGERRTGQR
jgi:hypothetical protein